MNLAYTLQSGREAMPYRWAAIVHDKDELLSALKAYPEGKVNIPSFNGYPGEEAQDMMIASKAGTQEISRQMPPCKRGHNEVVKLSAKFFICEKKDIFVKIETIEA